MHFKIQMAPAKQKNWEGNELCVRGVDAKVNLGGMNMKRE